MKSKPLGCISIPGILIGVLLCLLVSAFSLGQGNVLFSPGELSQFTRGRELGGAASHAGTGGNCAACHTPPFSPETMAQRCLACHTNLTSDPENFHRVMLAQSQQTACYRCHPDHRGANAALTITDLSLFPHDQSGFSLSGHQKKSNGAGFACADCHTGGYARFEQAACQDCHLQVDLAFSQAHAAEFGKLCLDCHDGADRYGSSFDHQRTAFPLEGLHAPLACSACHPGAHSASDLQSTPQDCFTCHAKDDSHQGKFGRDCKGCHTAQSWKQATFDHARSAFPLTGAHVQVACDRCHQDQFKGTPKACSACHNSPASHPGVFEGECDTCHSTDAWTPAQFNGKHTFPIDHGEGGLSACKTCHPQDYQTYTCYSCHEHQANEVSAKHLEEGINDFQDCTRCHPTGREEEGEDGEHEGGGD